MKTKGTGRNACATLIRHHVLSGKEVIYSDGSEAPKTEGGLPARLFRNDLSPAEI